MIFKPFHVMKTFTLLILFLPFLCLGQDYFPLQIGNVWIYERLDRQGIDRIELIDTTKINNQTYYIHRETFAGGPDDYDTYCRKDTLDQVLCLFDIGRDEQIIYMLDVPVGTSWDNPYMTLRRTLEDTSAIQYTPAGTFYNCYHYSTIDLPYYMIDTHRWLAPDIGLVHREDEGEGAILQGAYVNGVLYGDTTTTAVDIADDINSLKFELCQNYPNPFNQQTIITYSIENNSPSIVRLIVYNLTGNKIKALVHEVQSKGNYSILWDGRGDGGLIVSSGIYLYKLSIGDLQYTRRLTIVK